MFKSSPISSNADFQRPFFLAGNCSGFAQAVVASNRASSSGVHFLCRSLLRFLFSPTAALLPSWLWDSGRTVVAEWSLGLFVRRTCLGVIVVINP
jgi:hypothetical protein